MSNIIQVSNLRKTFKGKGKKYSEVTAVKDINFHVEQGEIFGFLGRNGAGKSTSIKMITGQMIPTSGSIEVCGINPVKDEKKLSMKIGIVPELPNLYKELTVKENLYFFAELYSLKKSRADELMEQFQLKEHGNKNVEKLSKGWKQKVLIARALLHNPEILFLDEPTSGLDPNNALELRNIIRDFKAKGKTVFITTHNMNEAKTLCDRVAIMKEGNILELDTPHNLKLKHSSKKIKIETEAGVKEYSYEEFVQLKNLDLRSLKTIHSTEPSLEDVFVTVTGGEN